MYIYEMHQHSAACSKCGKSEPEDIVRELGKDGFAGVVVTEHFYHGNTAISRELPWEEFCAAYIECYERMKRVGDELGVDVLFGIEEGIGEGKELLLYGITPDFILAHPELRHAGQEELCRLVHEAGGLAWLAHPYRRQDYIPEPDKLPDLRSVDGVESFNACNRPEENEKAAALAKERHLPEIAGSDAHTEVFPKRCGIACTHRIRTERELAEVLRAGDYTVHIG